MLTSKMFARRRKGAVYAACVRSVLLYGCETWAVKDADSLRLERTDRTMIRWISGLRPGEKMSYDDLCKRMGVVPIGEVMRDHRLRWLGHVERVGDDSWVSKSRKYAFEGPGIVGAPPKNWEGVLREDCKGRDMLPRWVTKERASQWVSTLAQDRELWKLACKGKKTDTELEEMVRATFRMGLTCEDGGDPRTTNPRSRRSRTLQA